MTEELWILSYSAILGIVQLLASSQVTLIQRGKEWAAGPRDATAVPLTGVGGRIDRAFKNFLETFPFFAVAILVAHAAGCHNKWTMWGSKLYLGARVLYVPAYIVGIPFLRTAIWFVSFASIIGLLLAPMIA